MHGRIFLSDALMIMTRFISPQKEHDLRDKCLLLAFVMCDSSQKIKRITAFRKECSQRK